MSRSNFTHATCRGVSCYSRGFLLFANFLIDWRREMERVVEKTGTQASARYHAA